jgi:hypothetical protein
LSVLVELLEPPGWLDGLEVVLPGCVDGLDVLPLGCCVEGVDVLPPGWPEGAVGVWAAALMTRPRMKRRPNVAARDFISTSHGQIGARPMPQTLVQNVHTRAR